MTKANTPSEEGKNIISTRIHYFRIGKAAEMLGCSTDELLHLGAMGKIEVMAPVFSNEPFELGRVHPISGFIEIAEPLQAYFSPTDRVILSKFDLSHIEAAGWVVPLSFKCPPRAKDAIEQWSAMHEIVTDEDRLRMHEEKLIESREKAWRDNPVFLKNIKIFFDDNFPNTKSEAVDVEKYSREAGLEAAKDAALYGIWTSVQSAVNVIERTSTSHLFISKKEMTQILSGQESDSPALKGDGEPVTRIVHGNANRFSNDREAILRVGIYAASRNSAVMESATKWAEAIEQRWQEAYQAGALPSSIKNSSRDEGAEPGQYPPSQRSTIENLLREVMQKRKGKK